MPQTAGTFIKGSLKANNRVFKINPNLGLTIQVGCEYRVQFIHFLDSVSK